MRPLAYAFTKPGDNRTNNDQDILIDISNSTQNTCIPSGNHAEWAK